MKSKSAIAMSSLALMLVLSYNACSDSGGSGGNPGLSSSPSLSGNAPTTAQGTSLGNPMKINEKVEIDIAPFPVTMDQRLKSLFRVKMCVKELRLKTLNSSSAELSTPIEPADLTLQPDGTHVTSAMVPPGDYHRLEIELDTHCASGESLSISTPLGNLAFSKPLTLPLGINLSVANGAHNHVDLAFEQLLDALANLAADLKALLIAVFSPPPARH